MFYRVMNKEPQFFKVGGNDIHTTGLIVFDTDFGLYQFNAGTPAVPDWQNITPAAAASYWIDNMNKVFLENLKD